MIFALKAAKCARLQHAMHNVVQIRTLIQVGGSAATTALRRNATLQTSVLMACAALQLLEGR